MKKNNKIILLVITLVVPQLAGILSAFMARNGIITYKSLNKPPLSPPSWVFWVVWPIIYFIMGLASYMVLISDRNKHAKVGAIFIYGAQLIMNIVWPIMFFNWRAYVGSIVWLIMLLAMVILCAYRFYDISKLSAYLFIPYILWIVFAIYLSVGVYTLLRSSVSM